MKISETTAKWSEKSDLKKFDNFLREKKNREAVKVWRNVRFALVWFVLLFSSQMNREKIFFALKSVPRAFAFRWIEFFVLDRPVRTSGRRWTRWIRERREIKRVARSRTETFATEITGKEKSKFIFEHCSKRTWNHFHDRPCFVFQSTELFETEFFTQYSDEKIDQSRRTAFPSDEAGC